MEENSSPSYVMSSTEPIVAVSYSPYQPSYPVYINIAGAGGATSPDLYGATMP